MMNHGIHRIHGMVLLAVAALGTSLAAFAADPGITVSARQRYPWNGLVDLHFTITGDAGVKYDTSFTAKDMVGNTNIAMKTIRKADGTAAAAKEQLMPDTYNWVWDAAADLPKDFKCDRVTVTGTAVEHKYLYMVIDLSGGANASSYPVSYLNDVPSGGWSDVYKTSKLVLRHCSAGKFIMDQSGTSKAHDVTLTKAFYIGIFEITQRQYELITGGNSETSGWKYPKVRSSWNDIRGATKGVAFPSNIECDSYSFIGKVRARTSFETFDLPSEAQWQYACVADGNLGDSVGSDYPLEVGSKKPNGWGIYDMLGNVEEWTTDRYTSYGKTALVDPVGGTSSGVRIIKGAYCRQSSSFYPGYRYNNSPSYVNGFCGFRVCVTLSE